MTSEDWLFSFEQLAYLVDIPTILDHIAEPICVTDISGRAVYFNPRFREEFWDIAHGLKKTESLQGLYRDPAQRDRIVEVLKSGNMWEGLVEVNLKGDIVLVNLHASPIIDPQKGLVAILSSCRKTPPLDFDTERLIQNEKRYLGLLQSKNDLILSVDADYRYISANEAYCRVFGKSIQELVGRTFTPLIHPDDLQQTLDKMKDLDHPPHRIYVEQRALTSDGWRYFAWEDWAIHDSEGRIVEIQAIGRDITDLKVATEKEVRQRTLAESLRGIAEALASTLDLEELWNLILNEVGRIIPHDSASFMKVYHDNAIISRVRGYETLGVAYSLIGKVFPFDDYPLLLKLVNEKTPLLIPDVTVNPQWRFSDATAMIRSYLGVPILVDGEVMAILNLDSLKPDFFTNETAESVRVFAVHAGLAMKNAMHYQKAQELAAYNERDRIARELHDVVNQTLFSAKMVAGSLSRKLEKDTPAVKEGLLDVQSLMDRALDEMRTLLYELRPRELAELDISALITQVAMSFKQRDGIDLFLTADEDLHLPPEVKIAFYRIAQEALNNVTKHASARQLWITLKKVGENGCYLSIRDDGVGFDTELIHGHSLGLGIMRDRAAGIEANLSVRSKPARGTEIELAWES